MAYILLLYVQEHLFCLRTFDLMLREKELCNAVFSLAPKLDSFFFAGFLEELMGNLKENTYTVTGFSLCIFSCTMLQIFHDPQSICDRIMGLLSFDVDHCTDTTVVMFKFGTVKPLLCFHHFFHLPHPFYLNPVQTLLLIFYPLPPE